MAEPNFIPSVSYVKGKFDLARPDFRRPTGDYIQNEPGFSGLSSILDAIRNAQLANDSEAEEDKAVSEITRQELDARLEASEARVAMAVESMRADAASLRADVRDGLNEIKIQGVSAQASAEKFYADAGKLLAEIHLANERQKVELYGLGYKVIAWTLGTMLAVGSVAVAVYGVISPRQQSVPSVPAPVSSVPSASATSSASTSQPQPAPAKQP